jgi:amino acid adenylation domain-containing protein
MSILENSFDLSLEEKRALARKLLRDRNKLEAGPVPLSEGQRALWFVHQIAPRSPAYNFVYAARLLGAISEPALREAAGLLFQRHPLLRSTFVISGGKPQYRACEQIDLDLTTIDAAGWRRDRLIAHIRSAALLPFDLEKGPCIRFGLYRVAAAESVLSLAVHHILADLWSMNLLVDELRVLYAAVAAGRMAVLPAPTARYADYVQWQRNWLGSPHGTVAWEFWKSTLADAPLSLDLPTDRPRPRVQTFSGSAVTFSIPPEDAVRLRELAAREKTTLFTVILSAFLVFLRRYSGQDDLVIGTATAGRGRPEWERVVGYFLNQVPLRVRVDSRLDFLELLKRVQRVLLAALDHQDFPFSVMVERLRPARDPSRPPIFQVMFIWDKSIEFSPQGTEAQNAFGASAPEPLVMEQCGAPFDLTLIIFENGNDLTASLRYNIDLFDKSTIERMALNLQALLALLRDYPARSLSEQPIVSVVERDEILRLSAGPNRGGGRNPRPFHRVFEEQVERSPAAPAVIFDGRKTTYGELNARANRLAHHLGSLGVAKGDLVGICLHRSCEMIVSVLAVWKAGAAYVPLDPAYPRRRLAGMIEDARPGSIISTAALAPGLGDYSGSFVLLDGDARIANQPDFNPDVALGPEDPAYAIFTSGSTGKPKAALLLHRGLANLAEAQIEVYGLGPEDRVLQFASLSFDASVFDIVLALRVGATLVVAGQSAILPGPDLIALIGDQQVTAVQVPPSVLALFPSVDLPEVRTLNVVGEVCPASVVSQWAPGRRFFNAYGPTETTVWASTALCIADGRPPTIGRPIANTRLLVLDENLQLLPIGVPGELHIAGPGVGLGYLNRPDLTLERFVPNPYGDESCGMLYKTGDIARLRRDGELEFLGRRDHQIKIRGYRVDLGEVRELLRQHPAADDAWVIARTLEGCESPSLVAYLACAEPDQCPIAEIRSYLRERLPYYMVPSALVPVIALPLAPSGKIDPSALPSLEGTSCRPDRLATHDRCGNGAPTTPVEAKLAEIWRTVLNNGPVGIHDNFFDLGGASLQTLEVAAMARNAGMLLSPELILQHQSIAELAPRCRLLADQGEAAEPAIDRAERPKPESEVSPTRRSRSGPTLRTVIGSLGIYVPDRKLSTNEVVNGCQARLDLPIARMTGIKNRRIAGDGEYSIDLAANALARCLSRSGYRPDEIDLLICCNISRCDGPDFHFSYEPSTAARLQERFGIKRALAFDLSNACAGTFTAIAVADCFFQAGTIRNALVVSGEYITHLTRTAQLEIESFVDPRLACLTLGDSGVAILLESSESGQAGFDALDLMTLGAHSDLCVARATDRPHGGAIMLTDAVKASAVTIQEAVAHAIETLTRSGWLPESIDQLIMHQTSETTLDGAVREINRVAGREAFHRGNTIYNLADLGNTATNTHMLALASALESGRIGAGSKVVFAISGSGQTVGTALYTFGAAPEHLVRAAQPIDRGVGGNGRQAVCPEIELEGLNHSRNASVSIIRECCKESPVPMPPFEYQAGRCVRVAAVATTGQTEAADAPCAALAMAVRAAESCIEKSSIDRTSIGLVLHSGVYRDDFQSEPALAAVAAGRLGINHQSPLSPGRKTLAFDLTNGALGALDACLTAACWIRAGRASRALVLASEVENNAQAGCGLLGLYVTGSAILLEESAGDEGFGRFCFRSFPEHAADIRAFTKSKGGPPILHRECRPEWEHNTAAGLRLTVTELLAREQLAREQIALVLPPLGSGRLVALLADALQIPRARFIEPPDDRGDYFTSSLAYGFGEARQAGSIGAGSIGLILLAGSGGQVGCCLYHF